jgi:hypothetical protein
MQGMYIWHNPVIPFANGIVFGGDVVDVVNVNVLYFDNLHSCL